MKATCNIPSFPFARSILHIGSDGGAFRVQPPFTKDELGRLDGRVLATFPLATAADAHPDMWEMHPAADEVLFMLSGELQVEYSDGAQGGTALLKAGEGLVMPQGVWHRLILRDPGLLQALTAPRGTESRSHAGGRP